MRFPHPMSPDGPAPTASALGHWGVTAPGSPNLHLTDDGRFTGTDGCNRMFGSWSEVASADDPSATTVRFTGVGMTKMMCPDVDTWLERIDTGRLVGDELHILAADGTEIGSLGRAG